jgi:phenylalanine-4-hydroxylase
MAVGEQVVSAFNGPADLKSFDLISHELSDTTIKKNRDSEIMKLEAYYHQVRQYREGKSNYISRGKLFEEFKEQFPNDWLLPVELYEVALTGNRKQLAQEIKAHLETVKQNRPKVGHLIDDGLQLVEKSLAKQS